MSFRQAQELAADWFKAAAVKSRLGYHSADPEEDKRKDKEADTEDAQQAALD
jgi:hypothetical protein